MLLVFEFQNLLLVKSRHLAYKVDGHAFFQHVLCDLLLFLSLSFSTSFSASLSTSFSTSFSTTFFSTIGKTFLPAIIITRLDNAALIAQILHVTDIIILFRYGQLIYIQAFAGICQTWGLGCLADLTGLEKLDPFIQIVHRQLIEVVHAESR